MFEGYTEEEIASLSETTGMESLPESDRRPPLIKWNMDITDDAGNKVHPNKFYNCQTGEQSDYLLCALLFIRPGREKSTFDKGRKNVACKSFDRQIGMNPTSGELRDCENCPDRAAPKGERKKCTLTLRFVAYDLERNFPFVFDVMRTSYIPMSRHLERNFYGQVKIGDKRKDLPLYMLATRLTLKEEPWGDAKVYYVPVPTVDGPIASKETVMALRDMAEHLKKMKKMVEEADEKLDKGYAANNMPPQGSEEPPQHTGNVDDSDVPF